MTENEINERLKDWRILCGYETYEYYYDCRKVEKWCVTTSMEYFELNSLKPYETPIFIGSKEECEKWIEEHKKKTCGELVRHFDSSIDSSIIVSNQYEK